MSKHIPVKHAALNNAPYELISLIDLGGKLTLHLEDANGISVNVSFDGYVFYSKMDEGDALRTLDTLKRGSCIGFILIEVNNSDLLNWFEQESYGVRFAALLSHYMILTQNDVVNVIAIGSPCAIGV